MSSFSFSVSLLLVSLLVYGRLVSADGEPPSTASTKSVAGGAQAILLHLQNGNIDAAHDLLVRTFDASERNPNVNEQDPNVAKLSQRKIRRGGGLTYTSEYKLRADIEQVEYLLQKKDQDIPDETLQLLEEVVLPTYKRVLRRIPPVEDLITAGSAGLYQFQQADYDDGISKAYNKALWMPNVTEWDEQDSDSPQQLRSIPVLSDSFNAQKIESEWFGNANSSDKSLPSVVVIDNVLSSQALDRVRRVLLESTVWYQTKLPQHFGTYTGAYIDDGLHDRILLSLAVELRKALPGILQDHPLRYLWAYKYCPDGKDRHASTSGINLHADEAAVNVNLWLTPDIANLDPESGGLVVFTVKPPLDWDLQHYNQNTSDVYEKLLRPANFANITVPFRYNRAVIFDSALFHQTDIFSFRDGYENHRINLTLLYGQMQKAAPISVEDEL